MTCSEDRLELESHSREEHSCGTAGTQLYLWAELHYNSWLVKAPKQGRREMSHVLLCPLPQPQIWLLYLHLPLVIPNVRQWASWLLCGTKEDGEQRMISRKIL